MKSICGFLKYKLVDNQELLDSLCPDGHLLLESYVCNREDKEGICTQVVTNFQNTGFGLLDPKEMGQCPYYP